MADENLQNRTTNMADQGAANGGQGTDPLAELARLIGQNDPFADFGRDRRPQPPAEPRSHPSEPPLGAPSYIDPRDRSGQPAQHHPEQAPPAFIQAGHAGAYRDGGQIPSDHDFDIESEPRTSGRKFSTLTAVIALAVVGIVGAFGYRVMFGGSSSAAPPPLIRANPEPTKVPPPTASAEASQSKSTYDRVGDRAQGERFAPREEPPVDVNSLTKPGVGRNPPPPQNPAGQWNNAAAPNLPGASASAPSAMGEPKRVRTVTIRPDQSDANGTPSTLAPPMALAQPPVQNPRAAPPAASASTQPRERSPAPVTQSAPLANAPLALTDNSSAAMPRPNPTAAQPRQVQRQAPPPNSAQEAPAPRQNPQAVAQAVAPKGGGYLVQVSSQRSEGEAQAAIRTVQAKFPSVLGGQQLSVRRADLGERGTYYRAVIGPYGTRDQATQLCANLKAAGGDCIVQGN